MWNQPICKSRLIRLLINATCHTRMFGSELKGMRDILTREITRIPSPGKTGHQPQTFSVLRNRKNGPREKKACHSRSKNSISFFFFFAVVWISGWIFLDLHISLKDIGGRGRAMSLSGQRAEWKESIRWGRRGTEKRGEGIQLCPSLHKFHRRQMRREEKDKKL